MRSRTDGIWNMPLYRPPWGRSRPHLSLREGLEKPPFPSRFIVSDRSSPSRVRFAASRPGRLRADPKDALLTRGKGGGRAVGREGELAHDEGYYPALKETSLVSTAPDRPRSLPPNTRRGAGLPALVRCGDPGAVNLGHGGYRSTETASSTTVSASRSCRT